jgi:hypothetical protein
VPITHCKKSPDGPDPKVEIVERYHLIPGPYCEIPEGDDRQGCCGTLQKKFFQFCYKLKAGKEPFPDQDGTFYVGGTCADTLIKLLKKDGQLDEDYQPPKRAFNPLHDIPHHGPLRGRIRRPRKGGDGQVRNVPLVRTRLNAELESIFKLLAYIAPESVQINMYNIWHHLHLNPDIDSFDFAVTKLNNAIRDHKPFEGQSLRQIINGMAAKQPDRKWHEFHFDRVEQIHRSLSNTNSYIDPESEIDETLSLFDIVQIICEQEKFWVCRKVDDGAEVSLFKKNVAWRWPKECQKQETILSVGDWLKVRLGESYDVIDRHQIVGHIFTRYEPIFATIDSIKPRENFNFAIAITDDDRKIYVGPDILNKNNIEESGKRLIVEIVDGSPFPKVVWGCVYGRET